MNIESNLNNGLRCSVDWLSFTVEQYSDLETCLSDFGFSMEDFYESPRGANGYKKMLMYYGFSIRVLYDGNENMGIHFDFSGSAMTEFYRVYYESCFNIPTPWGTLAKDIELDVVKSLFRLIQRLGHVTRLDLAVDNMGCLFYSVKELYEIMTLGRFVSKWRNWRFTEEKETNGNCTGRTIYMGSRTSDIMLRVYDKELEQNKKYPDKSDPKHVNQRWVRWELELKDGRANMVLDKFLDGLDVGQIAVGILSNYFRIIVNDDSNKSRCSNDIKWSEFIGEVEALRLYVPPIDKTLEQKKEWLFRQCAPTIAAVIMAEHGDISFISECLDVNAMRMNRKLREMVTAVNPNWFGELQAFQGQ